MEIEFIESTHTYLVDGVEIPSVTQILSKITPIDFSVVKPKILKSAQDFGTHVHYAIECDGKGMETPKLSSLEKLSYEEYLRLKKKYNLNPIANEIVLVNELERYCGTADMVAIVDGEVSLLDVKTTSILHKDYLEWQLGMYALAMKRDGAKL